MTEQDPTAELKALSREHMRMVWQIAQMGGEQLNDDDRRTAAAMVEHSEYAHLWYRLDRLSDAEITSGWHQPDPAHHDACGRRESDRGRRTAGDGTDRGSWSASAFPIMRLSIALRPC